MDDGNGGSEEYNENNPYREPQDPTYTDMDSPEMKGIKAFQYAAPFPFNLPAAGARAGARYGNTKVNDVIRNSLKIDPLTGIQRFGATLGMNDYGGGYIGQRNIGGTNYHVQRGGGMYNPGLFSGQFDPFGPGITTLTPNEAQQRNDIYNTIDDIEARKHQLALDAIRNLTPAPQHSGDGGNRGGGFEGGAKAAADYESGANWGL
ncbi:MAG: hypothetical protein H8E94_03035 [Alphaproteobacteria bacterium]|nr:hypothetical protein [Alphaproteobacteria bacterium]